MRRMDFRMRCRMWLVMWMCDTMSNEERNELIMIQARVNSIIFNVERVNVKNEGIDMFHTELTDVSNRLQTLIENLEEMLELDTQYAHDVFEYLCEAPMEFTSPLDPPESRNPGIEQLISQLNVIIENQDEIEDAEA